MSFCPLMSSAEKKADCSDDCSLYWKDLGCLFRVQVKQLDALRRNNAEKTEKQAQETEAQAQARPFDFIPRYDPAEVFDILKREQPQIIALVLAYLEPSKAAVLLQFLPAEIQSETARLIATMDCISLEIVRGIERSIETKLSAYDHQSDVGGIESIVNILRLVDTESEKHIIESLEEKDPELAQELSQQLAMGNGEENDL